jgi:hypothetical protein
MARRSLCEMAGGGGWLSRRTSRAAAGGSMLQLSARAMQTTFKIGPGTWTNGRLQLVVVGQVSYRGPHSNFVAFGRDDSKSIRGRTVSSHHDLPTPTTMFLTTPSSALRAGGAWAWLPVSGGAALRHQWFSTSPAHRGKSTSTSTATATATPPAHVYVHVHVDSTLQRTALGDVSNRNTRAQPTTSSHLARRRPPSWRSYSTTSGKKSFSRPTWPPKTARSSTNADTNRLSRTTQS